MDNIANNNLASNLPEERGWEYKQICVTRVPGYGFGIAVSGGRDNPHFASGDPSIAVSDVLASGPAERLLQVNDRIISVNGISLQNVDYATAVQVLRDSGDTVTLVIKRRTLQHTHSHSASYSGPPLAALGVNPLPSKVTLTKNSKKEDFGIVLGCKLFIKEISSKARDQLLNTNQVLIEGDFITKLNNTNCNDLMSLKEAKKIIDSTKDKLHITVARDFGYNSTISHQTQSSISTTGDDFLTSGHQSYSNQNLYVQPPTRNTNINQNGGFEDKVDPNSGPNSLPDEKSNLAPRGRSRGPLSEANMNQLDNRNNMGSYGRSKGRDEPPRPPPPRAEDYYSSRRQIYEDDPIVQKNKQPIPDARFITFHKEGSVGIRLTGGNFVGIFVTAVQPGSPASLQGLQPGDKILKVNDMDMTGVTREEAVLFLLSLQDRIELIVQFCKEEYDNIVASQKGDSFYIKTHFHYENPAKGEMSFRSGDTFHVIDTLYNGVVGCWQVFRIGRNNQEVQKGIIPNKSRAEELATAQFNATKKEMSANESRGSFFKRRRSSNRRSKSLGKEHWDDILFSDTVSKFPAYERVLLKHPGFTRPVILFGPIADIAREKLLKDFPDKFISPQLDNSMEENNVKAKTSSNIIRLSAIRDVISTGKHALLDITPNAVERLNYAQMYPIVVFFKAETKIVIKQLRQGLPKSAHKSSKKLLEQCQKLDKVWNHVFSSTITLNDNTDTWYRKVREIIDKQQTGALWMSESKPEESLSDDFLFPMSSLRLSYASSPESDLEHSPGPPVSPGISGSNSIVPGRLTKASSDPSVVMPDSPNDVLPPYQPNYDSRYGFNNAQQSQNLNENQTSPPDTPLTKDPSYTLSNPDIPSSVEQQIPYNKSSLYGENYKAEFNKMDTRNDFGPLNGRDYNSPERRQEFNGDGGRNLQHKRQGSSLLGPYSHSKGHSLSEQSPAKEAVYGTAPDLPPRVDRAAKPMGLLTTTNKIPNGRSAHERLFGTKPNTTNESTDQNANESGNFNKVGSLDRSQNSKSDSLSSYDSFNKQQSNRIGPNAHDDLKTTLSKIETATISNQNSPSKYGSGQRWEQNSHRHGSKMDLKYGLPSGSEHTLDSSPRNSREMEKEGSPMDAATPRGSVERDMYRYPRSPAKHGAPRETKTDYGKYSRNNNNHSQIPPPEYTRSSHQDLRESQLSIHQQSPLRSPPMHHNGFDSSLQSNQNGNGGYKPVPPPKPKNYKPPYKQSYPGDGMVQSPPVYQHGKSHSNPVDQRNQNMNMSHHNYYYNTPPHNYHPDPAMRYQGGHYDMAPPYQESPRRHPSISYASRSEITSISNMTHQHDNPYGMEHHGGDILDSRPPVVDLQGSREQRGSAFELYRKPVGHNMRGPHEQPAFYGSQPNIAQQIKQTNSPKTKSKLTKAQSFKQTKSEGFSTPKFFRKLSFRRKDKNKDKDKEREGTPKTNRKVIQENKVNDDQIAKDYKSPEYKMVQYSDQSYEETESMYRDRKSMYQDRESLYRDRQQFYHNKECIYQNKQKIYQDRESLYQDKQKIYQDRESLYKDKHKIYQDRESLYQDKQKLYQDRESLYKERLRMYPDNKIYQDRISALQEKQQIYDSKQSYPDKKLLYQDLQNVREEVNKINDNNKVYQDFREVSEETTRLKLQRQGSFRDQTIDNKKLQTNKKDESVRTQLQRNNSLRDRMYQSFREVRKDMSKFPENNRLYQSLRQVRHDISNLQDNQKIYDDFLKLREEIKKVQSVPATDQNRNPQSDNKLYQDFRKLRQEVRKLQENKKVVQDSVHNLKDFTKASKRDITSAYVSDAGAKLVNEYWGVSLDIPEGAIPKGESREIYFVVSDPRLCNNGNNSNAPPLDLENGETMLSPLVMCGPQGTEFLKPVILNIPHYANTLPSLAISLKATDSEQELSTDWDNILLPSNHAANTVSVKVDHF
ncbi:tight junction protein ZO-1 isoform X2 [Aethina tumida]|uniref:tight junction protein ZO-1 isoform X2 n=1 Tax=Aethina tumida TaxID=116153 RepID=UPI00096B09C0|nr:tight junction protein ZO-1 isoform X2 [Aethina tumida]